MPNEIDTRSENAVWSWVEERIVSRSFKKCGHLRLVSILPMIATARLNEMWAPHLPIFLPNCECNSFEYRNNPLEGRIDHRLASIWLLNEPITCSTTCRLYEHRKWFKFKRKFNQIPQITSIPFKWFSKLPWQTQVLLIALLIILLIPKAVPPIMRLIQAIK